MESVYDSLALGSYVALAANRAELDSSVRGEARSPLGQVFAGFDGELLVTTTFGENDAGVSTFAGLAPNGQTLYGIVHLRSLDKSSLLDSFRPKPVAKELLTKLYKVAELAAPAEYQDLLPAKDELRSLGCKLGVFPLSILEESSLRGKTENLDWYADKLRNEFFTYYDVGVTRVEGLDVGPRVMRFELYLQRGKYVSGVMGIKNELAFYFGVDSVSILFTGGRLMLDVPRRDYDITRTIDVLTAPEFDEFEGDLPIPVGTKPDGTLLIVDLAPIPHILIGGASGSGKSVYLHNVICSLMYRFDPSDVELLLIDTKRIEFSFYKGFPYGEVYTDVETIEKIMSDLVFEMDERYTIFEQEGVRNVVNSSLPYKVIIIDEVGDLLTQASKDFQKDLITLLRKARAVGMHFISATQRPSAEVIHGDIKANMPGRLSFRVSSTTDSLVILDVSGAQDLLGAGDALFRISGEPPERIQGALITVGEIKDVVKNVVAEYGGKVGFGDGVRDIELVASPYELRSNAMAREVTKRLLDKYSTQLEALKAELFAGRLGERPAIHLSFWGGNLEETEELIRNLKHDSYNIIKELKSKPGGTP